jgi:ribose transport system ATP-binding protein
MTTPTAAADVEVLLDVRSVSKTFAGNKALDGVSLQVLAGEVTAIVGHNGSGKSTLMKVLAGIHHVDPGGDLGVIHEHGTVRAAAGGAELHFIHQDLGLVGSLSTVENLDLTQQYGHRILAPFRRRNERRQALALIERFGARFDVDEPVDRRSAAERAIIAIARATHGWTHDRNVLLLDEPTAALHGREVEELFGAVRHAAARGAGVVLVSHRLDEVLAIADRVIVLRNGRLVAASPALALTRDDLLGFITGRVAGDRPMPEVASQAAPPGDRKPRLDVRALAGGSVRGFDVRVAPGEVVGVSGLLGSGREEVAKLIFGAASPASGTVSIDGKVLAAGRPAAAVEAGVAYVPGDRASGVVATMTVRENVTLPGLHPFRRRLGHLDIRAEREEVRRLAAQFEVRPPQPELRLGSLSGGNQQKAVLAKWIRNRPAVLILEEPTQGVDAGSKIAIYQAVSRAAVSGSAVLVTSSDTEELVQICDRVLVLRDGSVAAELRGADLTESRLVHATL